MWHGWHRCSENVFHLCTDIFWWDQWICSHLEKNKELLTGASSARLPFSCNNSSLSITTHNLPTTSNLPWYHILLPSNYIERLWEIGRSNLRCYQCLSQPMSIFIVVNTIWAPWQRWDDEKWRACCWTWHVVFSAATSQRLPFPVPDVLYTVHVSTMWTTALVRCQTLRAANGHDGHFVTCGVIKF